MGRDALEQRLKRVEFLQPLLQDVEDRILHRCRISRDVKPRLLCNEERLEHAGGRDEAVHQTGEVRRRRQDAEDHLGEGEREAVIVNGREVEGGCGNVVGVGVGRHVVRDLVGDLGLEVLEGVCRVERISVR